MQVVEVVKQNIKYKNLQILELLTMPLRLPLLQNFIK